VHRISISSVKPGSASLNLFYDLNAQKSSSLHMLPYALSIFTGAFLLFQVQPIIGKYILPWFGGGPGVWTTCLLFFQTLLLGGYAYAHLLSTRLAPKRQAIVHIGLLVLSLALLPITPSESWKNFSAADPTWHILLLLTATIGLPYFVLSSTGPLMQHWFSQTNPGVSPYRLYALSNVGSLLALLSYPVFFEVKFPRSTQTALWSGGLVLFVIFCGYCAWRVWRNAGDTAAAEGVESSPADATAIAEPPAATESAEPVSRPAGEVPLALSTSAETEGLVPDNGGGAPPVAPPIVTPSAKAAAPADDPPVAIDKLLWMSLPAIASVLLLATTNKLSQEVAVIPFLWVLPLSLYLLSFIISFDHARWYHRGVFMTLLVVATAVVFQLILAGNDAPMKLQIAGYSTALFIACMVCHGELYRLKPPPRFLTSFYLFIAAGGALGGFLVAIVAPIVFDDYRELQLGLWVLSYLVGVLCLRHQSRTIPLSVAAGAALLLVALPWFRSYLDDSSGFVSELTSLLREHVWLIIGGLVVFGLCTFNWRRLRMLEQWQPRMAGFVMVASVGLGVLLVLQWPHRSHVPVLSSSRNFYGTLKVYNYHPNDEEDNYRLLLHGATTHGLQFVQPEKSILPTTYYGENSGVGLAIDHLPESPRRVGIVGLGTGSLLAYGRPEDYYRVYEINPEVEELARSYFTYLDIARSKVDVVMGDARLVMERELARKQPQEFDLLALDAFSSDAIPVHLLTREAFAMYLQHLKPGGVLAVHISNRYLNLRPIVERLAEEFGLHMAVIYDDHEPEWWIYATTWVVLSESKAFLEQPAIANRSELPESAAKAAPLWTDDYASLFSIMK
jgi:spermidine synthase